MAHRIVGYHHVTQNVTKKDRDAIVRFYRDVLGLEQISSAQQDPTGERLIWFAVGDRQLHLVVEDKADPPSTRHFAVLVDNIDELIRRLAENGYPASASGVRPNGRKYAFCHDPVGNRIELMENPS